MTVLRYIAVFLLCAAACAVDHFNFVSSLRKKFITPGYDCVTDNNKNGFCVRKEKCRVDTGSFDLRTLNKGEGCHYRTVCCEEGRVISSKKSVPSPVYQAPSQCGVSNPGGMSLRGMSLTAQFADFPWVVAVLRVSEMPKWDNRDYVGGGSIIHPSVVITAAHKVDEFVANEIKCRAGEWDTETDTESRPYQDRSVSTIVKHEDYVRNTGQYDVALLILTKPFFLEPHIGIVCLGSVMPEAGTSCYGTGWGRDLDSQTEHSRVLKKIPLNLVTDEQCETNLKNTRLGSTYSLHNSLTCAGGEEGVDTCLGDGGSPLVCQIPESSGVTRYAVYGLVAGGVDCGLRDVPGVYVNIPQVYQWVKDKMLAEGLPSTQFTI